MALTSARQAVALVALAALAALAACGGRDGSEGSDSARDTATVATPTAGGASSTDGAAPCPRTGHWTECIVFARLEQAGVAPRREGSADELPSLGVTPSIYMVGTARVAAYLFADAAARARAARQLDTLHFIAPSAPLTMRNEATVVQDDNLVLLLFTQREQQRERVSDAFLAGAPQP